MRAYLGGNSILDRLSPEERRELLPQLDVCFEEEASVIRARDQIIDAVHFPIDAIYSVVVELAQGNMYEVDVIGRDGAVGIEIALGARTASRTVLCQAPGSVALLPNAQFKNALDRSRTFLAAVRESLRRQWFDSQQTVACNFAHTAEQRTARWILMTQDQIGQDRFRLRCEFLSIMLGLSPAQVGDPLSILVQLGCIRYEDEELVVESRQMLEDYACECYGRQRTTPFIGLDGAP
jgi:CRP-like cAMP-binding protein